MADEDGYNIDEDSDSDDPLVLESDEEEENDFEFGSKEHDMSDDEVDFEQEMQNELEAGILRQHTLTLQSDGASTSSTTQQSTIASDAKQDATKEDVYDEDYFSSGSEDENLVGGIPSKSKQRRKVMTDEELFYDPDMDDEDEQWVTKQREMNAVLGKSKKGKGKSNTKSTDTSTQKAQGSDAILSCPACLTMLCIDCQRHEKYTNQYRAMFVMNCTVVKDEILRYKEQKHKNRRKQKGKLVQTDANSEDTAAEDEIYHPVKCTECSTEVAVFDSDEVYHFFDVLASYA